MKHLRLFEAFNNRVDMKKVSDKLERLKKENPGKKVTYTFSDQGSGGVVYLIDGKMEGSTNEAMYNVMNITDGILASPDMMTEEEADNFIHEFPKRSKAQGYYVTSEKERIDPIDVKLEKVLVEAEEDAGGEYEAAENITMRGFVGDFQLKRGDKVNIAPGKMPSKYQVGMPSGRTEVSTKVITDLISSGRLVIVPLDEEETLRPGEPKSDFPKGNSIELSDDQIAELKALKTAYVADHGDPHQQTYNTKQDRSHGFGGHVGEFYRITPEWQAFLDKIGVTQNMSFSFDEKAYTDIYEVRFKSKYPGPGKDVYGYIENIAIG